MRAALLFVLRVEGFLDAVGAHGAYSKIHEHVLTLAITDAANVFGN